MTRAIQRSPTWHPPCLREHFRWVQKIPTRLIWALRAVIYKLLVFTLAMIAMPIGTYFATVDVVFRGRSGLCRRIDVSLMSYIGNATYAGGLAAVVANVVLVAYVIVAMKEDHSEKLEAEQKAKKAQ
jgi:vacuolar ATPase assembly integral membrane protein VMA21